VNEPWGMILDDDGRIIISDTFNNRIISVDNMDGDNWTIYGSQGDQQDQFSYPASICRY
jgi:hypothetical protein